MICGKAQPVVRHANSYPATGSTSASSSPVLRAKVPSFSLISFNIFFYRVFFFCLFLSTVDNETIFMAGKKVLSVRFPFCFLVCLDMDVGRRCFTEFYRVLPSFFFAKQSKLRLLSTATVSLHVSTLHLLLCCYRICKLKKAKLVSLHFYVLPSFT